LFGALGMFLGVPIFAVVYTLIRQEITKQLAKRQVDIHA